ncbi:hypothetical protein BJY04DRAFT_213916 [Aspergillus karnatakaensis]|uniref:uncharacterized protein n=1 Tax=Aspergillus karnatakaensis TaxID=1810916 RepID=UPI003CCE3E2D
MHLHLPILALLGALPVTLSIPIMPNSQPTTTELMESMPNTALLADPQNPELTKRFSYMDYINQFIQKRAEQGASRDTELDKRFFYTDYQGDVVQKRAGDGTAGDNELDKRFFYTNYEGDIVQKRADDGTAGDMGLDKRFFYTNYEGDVVQKRGVDEAPETDKRLPLY